MHAEENNDETNSNSTTGSEVIFSDVEARVFGCLMEKNLTTPANYPLTINSLMLACNQKTNREPVMNMTEGEVSHTAKQLAERDFVEIDYGDRADKVRHKAVKILDLKREDQAVICMMLLRGPMTLNDIKSRTERMVDFSDTQEVKMVLDALIARDAPLVVHLEKGHGQREDRYGHLLCGDIDETTTNNSSNKSSSSSSHVSTASDYQKQIDTLTRRIEILESHLGLTDED